LKAAALATSAWELLFLLLLPLPRLRLLPPPAHCRSASAHMWPWLFAAISVWLRCLHATALTNEGGWACCCAC